jgi:hypothetical protein
VRKVSIDPVSPAHSAFYKCLAVGVGYKPRYKVDRAEELFVLTFLMYGPLLV